MKRRRSTSKRASAVGLTLWLVKVTNSPQGGLWITTRTHNISHAIAKTERFLQRHSDEYHDSEIMKIRYRGTIDA